MLPKKNRLKKEKDFKKIYKFGKKIKGDFFIIRYLRNKMLHSRFGFVVPGSVTKKAVKRNFIKRKLSESVRINLESIKKGYDVVVLIYATPPQKKRQFFEDKLLGLIKKVNLYISPNSS